VAEDAEVELVAELEKVGTPVDELEREGSKMRAPPIATAEMATATARTSARPGAFLLGSMAVHLLW
jgi:predicted N-acetyltransferase YhbS